MVFANAYAANPLCSPTRASILTGLYPARLGITAPVGHIQEEILASSLRPTGPVARKSLEAVSATRLPLEVRTLGEALGEAGYATGFFGKWHLGHPPYIAANQGFQEVEGGGPHPGPRSYFSPFRMEPYVRDGAEGEHIDDHLTDSAIQFMRAHADGPFYVNLWFHDVHSPYQGKQELVEEYEARVRDGALQRNPMMGAMVETMDACVGRVLDELKRLGLEEKTIVIFFSDNGGVHWPEPSSGYNCPVTSNDPLRGGKATIYEGGTREPMIVRWPGIVEGGASTAAFVSSVDFYPTILEVTGAALAANQKLDGVSFLGALRGGTGNRTEVFCHFPHHVLNPDRSRELNRPACSVRRGDWKLVRVFADGPLQNDRFELYNLARDIGEQENVADRYPEVVSELNARITAHLLDTGAIIPVPNPRYREGVVRERLGWRASGTCVFLPAEESLLVESEGGDPWLWADVTSEWSGPFTLAARLRSEASGPGQVFWQSGAQRRFAAGQSVHCAIPHGDGWSELVVEVHAEGPLHAVRLDPGEGEGSVEIDWVEVRGPDGRVIQRWDF